MPIKRTNHFHYAGGNLILAMIMSQTLVPFTMLPTIKFGERKHDHTKNTLSCAKNTYLSRRTYSKTSAELVEARVGLTSFENV